MIEQDRRVRFAMMQAFGWGVRALIDVVHASGPECLLPKIGRGPITAPLEDLAEDEVRKDIFERSKRKIEMMQECIDYVGEAINAS